MSISNDLGPIFADSLAEVVSTVSGITLRVLPSEHDTGFDEMVGIMCLNGKDNGTVFISAAEASMRALCSAMIGIPKAEVTRDDMYDTLCELVNMTAGNAKLRLTSADCTFTLSVPFLISGENMAISTKKRESIISNVLTDGKISLGLKIVQ